MSERSRSKCLQALEGLLEHEVEAVQVALVLHQGGAGEVVEVLDVVAGHPLLHRLEERQVLPERHRDAGRSEQLEEGDEHPIASWGYAG